MMSYDELWRVMTNYDDDVWRYDEL